MDNNFQNPSMGSPVGQVPPKLSIHAIRSIKIIFIIIAVALVGSTVFLLSVKGIPESTGGQGVTVLPHSDIPAWTGVVNPLAVGLENNPIIKYLSISSSSAQLPPNLPTDLPVDTANVLLSQVYTYKQPVSTISFYQFISSKDITTEYNIYKDYFVKNNYTFYKQILKPSGVSILYVKLTNGYILVTIDTERVREVNQVVVAVSVRTDNVK